MDCMSDEIDSAAQHTTETLCMGIDSMNRSIADGFFERHANGYHECTPKNLGR